jgi:lambda family phage portal protein
MANHKPIIIEHGKPVQEANGGAIEGAERNSRETLNWNPTMRSPDQVINFAKPMADARGRDMVMNDGYAAGAETLHKDNIVGSQYRLNAQPNYKMFGPKKDWPKLSKWAEEFQIIAEARFMTVADSEMCYLDASGMSTLTGLVRMAVGGFVMTGEVLATGEWLKDPKRPFKTAVQMVSPDRLTNPFDVVDTKYLRRGIEKDRNGMPIAYHFRNGHPSDPYLENYDYQWTRVLARKPWGRQQVLHVIDRRLPDQSRGIAEMVAVLKQMKMTKTFQEITLQNAVINASFAASIESDLPPGEVFAALGAGTNTADGMMQYFEQYMGALGGYLDSAKNISVDGAKIPHLFPGTKLNMQPVGTPGGVGSGFEESLLRHIAANLGLSYEQFSRDYTKTNYSSARASMNESWKFMQARKQAVADRTANFVYQLWLEEDIANGNLPLPPGKTRAWFYEPLVKDALCKATWIGASRGQIDEMKETQAAVLRINSGLSTYEKESARLGDDFRAVFEQRSREQKIMKEYGLDFNTATEKPSAEGTSKKKVDKANSTDEDTENE